MELVKIIIDGLLFVGIIISAVILQRKINALNDLIITQSKIIETLKQGINDISGVKDWYKKFSDDLADLVERLSAVRISAMKEIQDIFDKRVQSQAEYIAELEARKDLAAIKRKTQSSK